MYEGPYLVLLPSVQWYVDIAIVRDKLPNMYSQACCTSKFIVQRQLVRLSALTAPGDTGLSMILQDAASWVST